MKREIYNVIIFILFFFTSCKVNPQNKEQRIDSSNRIKAHINHFLLTESKNQDDSATNNLLSERLKPIRENFKKINSITLGNWSNVETEYLEGSNEGGEATFYFWNANLDKIISKEYGETYQTLTEYYFLNNNLSFVFEKNLRYNRPFYYDSSVVRESGDTEIFDFDKSEIEEHRYYFDQGKLIFQLYSPTRGSSFSNESLLVQEKIVLKNLTRLMKLRKGK